MWRIALMCWVVVLGGWGCKGSIGAGACGDCPAGHMCFEGDCRRVCSRNSDCRASEVCRQGHCMPSTGGDDIEDENPYPDCPNPPIPSVSASTTVAGVPNTIYAGQRYRVQGSVHNSTLECPIVSSWWVCDAPADSTYFSATDGGCRLLIQGHAELAFRPDRRGAYRLEFRGTNVQGVSATTSLSLTALAQDILVQLTFGDSRILWLMMGSPLQGEPCHGIGSASACDAAVDCAWQNNFCWRDCAVASNDATACADIAHEEQGTRLCTYNDPVCAPDPDVYCSSFTDEQRCSSVEPCHWHTNLLFCSTFSCGEISSQAECEPEPGGENIPLCAWAPGDPGECVDGPGFGLPQFMLAQVGTDGGRLGLLRFVDPANPSATAQPFVYDRNSVFAGPEQRLGLGVELSSTGMAFLPDVGAAVFPVSYIFYILDDLGDEPVQSCWLAQVPLLWRSGGTAPGLPLSQPLELLPANDNLVLSETGGEYLMPLVGYPAMLQDSSERLWVTFGVAQAMPPSDPLAGDTEPGEHSPLPSCEDFMNPDVLHLAAPFFYSIAQSFANDLAPIRAQAPFAVHLARVDGDAVFGSELTAGAEGIPCGANRDCFADCAAGYCPAGDPVHGYLPRVFADGNILMYSHVSCSEDGGAYGSACAGKASAEYDLMWAQITENSSEDGFAIGKAQRVAAVPNIREMDALPVGEPTPESGRFTLYYLEIDMNRTLTLDLRTDFDGDIVRDSVTDSFDAQVPAYRVVRRELHWNGEEAQWTVDPLAEDPAVVVFDDMTELLDGDEHEDFHCAVKSLPPPEPPRQVCGEEDGEDCVDESIVRSMWVTTNYLVKNPIQITLSPDKSTLAFTSLAQNLACGGNRIVPSAPVAGDIYLIDLSEAAPTPRLAYPSSCNVLLEDFPVRQTPQFVAGGDQLVFMASGAGDAGGMQVFRMNVADVGASECLLDPVVDLASFQSELRKTIPSANVLGASLAVSRSGTYDACTGLGTACTADCGVGCEPESCDDGNCNGTRRRNIGGGEIIVGLFGGWLLMKWRRRRERRAGGET